MYFGETETFPRTSQQLSSCAGRWCTVRRAQTDGRAKTSWDLFPSMNWQEDVQAKARTVSGTWHTYRGLAVCSLHRSAAESEERVKRE